MESVDLERCLWGILDQLTNIAASLETLSDSVCEDSHKNNAHYLEMTKYMAAMRGEVAK